MVSENKQEWSHVIGFSFSFSFQKKFQSWVLREGKGYRFRFWVNEKGREILKVDGIDKGVLVSELYGEESLWFEKGDYIFNKKK